MRKRRRDGDLADGSGQTPVLRRLMGDVDATIREVLDAHGRLPVSALSLSESDNLYVMGLSSHASVNVMLALEDAFDIEFPDALLRKSTFESIAAIRDALGWLGVVAAPN